MTTNGKTRVRFRTPNFSRLTAVFLGLLCFTAQACLLVNTASAYATDVASKLRAEIEHMALENKPTFYEDVERRVAALLKQVTNPPDQAELWNELTEIYFNGGGPAKRTAECAKRTLELPIAAEKRVRLYWIWADAEARFDPAKDRAAQRKIAAPLYLQAVAEFRKLKLPAVAVAPAGSPPPAGKRRYLFEPPPGETERTREIRLITMARDSCLNAIESLYVIPPYAPDGELRAQVMEKLNDPDLADELTDRVDKVIAAHKAQLAAAYKKAGITGPIAPSAKHDLPPAPSRARQVLLLSSFLLILTVVLVARRWHASP